MSEQNLCAAFDLSSISLATIGIIGMKASEKDNLSYATVLGEKDDFLANEKRYASSCNK